jgi:hypothetical protein
MTTKPPADREARRMMNIWKDKTIVSRDGKHTGTATGSTHYCRLEGCGGVRVSVKWAGGKRTFPCSRGLLAVNPNTFRIE